jgi:hypothetical protein
LVPHLEVAIFGDKGEGQGGGGKKAGGMTGWQIAVAMAAAWTGGSALIAFGLGGLARQAFSAAGAKAMTMNSVSLIC